VTDPDLYNQTGGAFGVAMGEKSEKVKIGGLHQGYLFKKMISRESS